MAKAGDVKGLWELLITTNWSMIDLKETFRYLAQALEVRSADTREFTQSMYQRSLTFVSYLMLRSQYFLNRRISAHDGNQRSNPQTAIPPDGVEMVEALFKLQRQYSALAESHARTTRLQVLAEQKQEDATNAKKKTRPKLQRDEKKEPSQSNRRTKGQPPV